MKPNIFSPRLSILANKDNLSALLKKITLVLLTGLFGFLPLIFFPGSYTFLGFTKTFLVAVGILMALIIFSLAVLRTGKIKLYLPISLSLFWGFAILALASAALSGDIRDSLLGLSFEIHTAGFVILMALIMTVSLLFVSASRAIWNLYGLLAFSAMVLYVYHISRVIFGADFLTLGLFDSATVSPIGSFNDLAIFSGLVILVTLVLIERMTVTIIGKIISTGLLLGSLLMLILVNFSAIWVVVGFFSLITLLYLVSRDTWLNNEGSMVTPVSRIALGLVLFTCLISGSFVIGGEFLGKQISNLTNVSYLEVRPSFDSTLALTKAAWSEDALFGVGPNRFEDAWREYKNPVINQTAFWNTNFNAGSGYLFTTFITNGLAGMVFILLFLASYLYAGYRLTLKPATNIDEERQLIGSVVVVSSLYLWLMTIIYVPGATIMILLALFTGLTLAMADTEKALSGLIVDVADKKRYGLLLIATVLIVIITSTLIAINLGRQYISSVVYADTVRAFQSGASFNDIDAGLIKAFELYPQDLFLSERSQLRLIEIRKQANGGEISALDQQRNATLLSDGVSLAEKAITLDPTNPNNYLVLTGFYSLLNPADFDGLKEKVDAVYSEARKYDPSNPIYLLSQAQYKVNIGDLGGAKAHLEEAVNLKNNYAEALFLLAQIDINEGNVKNAIALTSAIISIEPNNPTRYFQLGVLLGTDNQLAAAVEAFESAVSLDPNYANARYFLALTYLELDRNEDALVQLNLVEKTNQDNQLIKQIISEVESGTYVKNAGNLTAPVSGPEVVRTNEGVTTSTEVPDTSLVSPVNQVIGN